MKDVKYTAVANHTERVLTPPTPCPFCNGEREWSGNYSGDGWPEADCYFCGRSTIVKG